MSADLNQFIWAAATWSEVKGAHIGRSLSGKRWGRGTGVHRFAFELVSTNLSWDEAKRLAGKVNGSYPNGTLSFVHHQLSNTSGTAAALSVASAAASRQSSVTLTASTPWQLLAGDVVRFAGHRKVYPVIEDTALAVGDQVVSLGCPLRSGVAYGEGAQVTDVPFTLELEDLIEVETEAPIDTPIELVLELSEQ